MQCTQIVYLPEGGTEVCGRECEYHYSRRVRELGLASGKYQGQYKLCSAHKALVKRYGVDSERVPRLIGKQKGRKHEPVV